MVDDPNRTSKGTFKKGNKANPGKGRPLGSRNKRTVYEELLHEHGPQAVRVLIVEAIRHRNPSLLAFYVDKLVPRRGARLEFDAPKMAGVDDMPGAIAAVRAMMADGTLSLDEGQALITTYLAQGQAIEMVDLKGRLEAMEMEVAELREREGDE